MPIQRGTNGVEMLGPLGQNQNLAALCESALNC
jgi:hypothetical protein